ncbi:MAG: polymerase [Chloroflexi bacterium AL-W]|nr:polymerase [Chloroflexi bacterium AL-N1]NOK68871.1 polymerase [Chloroflexi bacterium AL-N10]NOK76854.1 polymerase [Chloroflexi bacterium AL-N5]NOK82758.1 polymerase [Chloroflexi bacterium AL-W]NOK90711.1 polymerase [Chloroflexi bacterium AL-N15]
MRIIASIKPYRRALALLLIAALLLILLAAVVWFDNAVNRGITYTPDPQAIPFTEMPPVGVNAFNIQFEAEEAKVTQTLEMARDLGAHFVRIQMPWDDVEIAGKGDFEDRRNPERMRDAWEKYDFIVAEANRLELDLIVRIDRPPQWARAQTHDTQAFQEGLANNPDSTGPPDDYDDFGDFVGAMAERYRGQVNYIQLWNEPNLAYEWNWTTPDPEGFVELLRIGYIAAKAANPDVVILFPSLAPTDGLDRQAPMTELEYLDRVYAAGGDEYFDIMSAQAYGLGQPPDEHRYVFLRRPGNWSWSRPIDTRIDVSRLVLLREVMERHGDYETSVWISEFGYNSAPEGVPGRNTWGEPVTEEVKGEYLIGQLERARQEWPWVGVMNLWFLRWGGEQPDPNNPTPYFAIVDPDFNPLPAYTMIQEYLADGPVAGVGAHTWKHPAVQSSTEGMWDIRFEGSTLALQGRGSFQVTINESMPIDISLDGGEIVEVARDLPDGVVHMARVEDAGEPPEVFVVGRTPPVPWFWTLAPAVVLIALIIVSGLLLQTLFIRGTRRVET